jgi:hypothetical protein
VRRDTNIALDCQAYALNVLTPIAPGLEMDLREQLEAIEVGPASPFARVPGTHFARLVVIDRLAFEGRPERKPELRLQYLLFSSVFDGGLDDYLRALCDHIPRCKADAIWGSCAGAPQPVTADAGAFAHWIRHNQIHTDAFFAPYGGATVDRIRHSLRLRGHLAEFARETQYWTPPELKKHFDEDPVLSSWGAAS